jgi:hypothetical protein
MAPVDGASFEQVRHCAQCDRDVYDVSAMAGAEAEAFLRARVGARTCVRLLRRDDGTLVTRDCADVAPKRRLRILAASTLVASACATPSFEATIDRDPAESRAARIDDVADPPSTIAIVGARRFPGPANLAPPPKAKPCPPPANAQPPDKHTMGVRLFDD